MAIASGACDRAAEKHRLRLSSRPHVNSATSLQHSHQTIPPLEEQHGRFRDSDLLSELFKATVRRCIEEALVGRRLRRRRESD
jgi:hypothetical protein